jgi:hypothetical protein
MAYDTNLVNNIHLSVSGVDEIYMGADDWRSIGPDGNYISGTNAGKPADKVWIEYTVRWYEPAHADKYAVYGDSSAFEQYVQANDANFFNNCVVEISNAANVIKTSFTGSVTEQAALNGFVRGIGGSIADVLDVNNLTAWEKVVDRWNPGSAMGNGAQAGTGEVGKIQGATPVERIIPGTDKKEWFVWTAFRVRPQVAGTADTDGNGTKEQISVLASPYPTGYGFLLHTLTEGQYKAWNSLTNNSQYSDTQELPTEEKQEAELVDTFVDMSKLLTNLPRIRYSRQAAYTLSKPKWREGLLHTWEGTPAVDGLKDSVPYGFRFHWNPAGWRQTASMNEAINPEQLAKSNPQQLPLMGGFANISLTIQLNRMYDLQGSVANKGDLNPTDSAAINTRALQLFEAGEYNYPKSDGGVPVGFDYGSISLRGDKLDDVKNLLRQGTLYDLDYLFAVTNGKTMGSYHVHYMPETGGGELTNPSYPGTTPEKAAREQNGIPARGFKGSPDYGFISAKPVRIWLGPHITFVGRIQSYTITHIMFTEYMIPIVTQVDLNLTRSITMGSTFKQSMEIANTEISGDNADITSTGDPNAEEPGS